VGINNDPFNDRFTYDAGAANVTLGALGITDVSTVEKENAQGNLGLIDEAIFRVNENRASLGALQNRLGSTINNLEIYRENIESANARIRDTDMAEATTELVKNNILSQANISTLSQANQNPQLALKLINNV
jgi:flagellin